MMYKLPLKKALITALLFFAQIFIYSSAHAQEGFTDVKGIVHDEAGLAVVGASVVIRNSQTNFTTGTTTDTAGIFNTRLTAGGPYVFTVKSVGYEPATLSGYNLKAGTTFSLDISLKSSAAQLNQVVVVGYGTQRKADITGAIVSVNASTIARAATPDATGALQGQMPGVVVVKNVGKPGSGYNINVRGVNTITGSNSPLFVIDGIPTTNGINDINPADIEKIDVLKDASATYPHV